MMGTVIIVLLIIIDVFNIGYMQLCKEPTWKTSINLKSNSRIGEVIFTIPDIDGKGKHQRDIQLCNTSNYFEMVKQNQWNHHAFTKTRGINYGFPYRLKVTCPERSDQKLVSWLSYKSIFVRIRFIQTRISLVAPEDVSPTPHLQKAANILDRDFIKFQTRSTDVIFRVTSMGYSTRLDKFLKRLKRACPYDKDNPRRHDCLYPDFSQPIVAAASNTAPMSTVGITPSTTGTTTITTSTTSTPSTTRMRKSTIPSTTQITKSTTPSTTQTMTTPTPLTTRITTSTTPSTTQMTTSIIPSTTQTTTSTLPSTIRTTTSTKPSTTQTKTSATPSTTRTTTNTTPSNTSTLASNKLNTTTTSLLSMTLFTTRATPGTTLSTTIDTSSTRLTTTTSSTQSTILFTNITTQSSILLTSQATSSITHSNVQTHTFTNSQKIQGSIQLTTTMNTEGTNTLCTACISTPSPSSSTKSHQNSPKTTPATKPTTQQTTTTCKSSKASKMATDSSMLGAYVSSSMEEITPMYDTTTNFTTSTVSTVFSKTTKHPLTDSFGSLKANTSILASVALSVASAPRELTTTSTSTSGTSPTETTLAPMDTAMALTNAEQSSSNAFIDDPLNVALVSILAGFAAIGSTAWIISFIRSKIAQTENNRSVSTVHESTSTSSSTSSISGDNIRYSGSSLSSNNMFSSTASNLSLLTPVETV